MDISRFNNNGGTSSVLSLLQEQTAEISLLVSHQPAIRSAFTCNFGFHQGSIYSGRKHQHNYHYSLYDRTLISAFRPDSYEKKFKHICESLWPSVSFFVDAQREAGAHQKCRGTILGRKPRAALAEIKMLFRQGLLSQPVEGQEKITAGMAKYFAKCGSVYLDRN